MNKLLNSPSLDSVPSSSSDNEQYYDDSALEGVAANVKLLLKLIQDHKAACDRGKNDGRRMLRVATMMTILDNVRTRIQKCQSFGNKSPDRAQLTLCNTDLKASRAPPRDKKQGDQQIVDEIERLRKQLNASLAARKSIEVLCSSLGKEKEIMSVELAKKVHELNEMDELINDLRVQNGTLLEKVQQHCGSGGNREKKFIGGEPQAGSIALQERNKALSEQLLRSLDGYRSMKRKLKEAQEENQVLRSAIQDMEVNVSISLEHIRGFKERMASSGNDHPQPDVQDDIEKLEDMIEFLEMQVAKHAQKKGECLKPKTEISTCQHSVLA